MRQDCRAGLHETEFRISLPPLPTAGCLETRQTGDVLDTMISHPGSSPAMPEQPACLIEPTSDHHRLLQLGPASDSGAFLYFQAWLL